MGQRWQFKTSARENSSNISQMQLQRKLNNSENIFVDNREPQCNYRKLPLISLSPPPPPPPTPVIWPSACKQKKYIDYKPPPNVWNWIWFIMAFWTLIKDSKYKKYFDQHRYSLSRSAFSIQGIIPHGYKPLRSISASKTPCEDVYFNLFSGDVH